MADGITVAPHEPADLDLTRWVRPGDAVVWGQTTAEPLGLTAALVAQLPRLGGPISGFVGITYADIVRPEHAERLRMRSYGAIGGPLARLARAGCLDVVPANISDLATLFRTRVLRADVVLVQVTPADADGWHLLGPGPEYLPEAIDAARVVLAEVNDRLPRVRSPYRLHTSRITVSTPVSRPLIQLAPAVPGPADRAVAEQVVALVPDGATLQFGIGRLPDAVLAALAGRRDLGIHSGLVTDAFVDLVEAGCVTNAHKGGPRPGISVTGSALGTDRLYDFVDDNPAVETHPFSATHDPFVLASLRRFVSVNAALEVDLSGQVAAEQVAGVHVGAVGGQGDFLRGAARSDGGIGVVALASTTPDGARSKIVARLDSGVVTTARADVDWVVTEHGAVRVRGSSLRDRAAALVGIAHPRFRDELAATAGL